ncbi:exosortase/archaeosortase family protein [Phragmitibacter flavus]|uniref:Exosortase/archaeosortase family protein n=1 Tax=Phragmitibacter flavus TaxID=2576071 RepID=A0A5R8K884_9BACT|nr:exosortase/archaeosortase family protein [Phragmitibacter flavus]TLD68523.1 exosortase/archaeosortase family protein [Phragmitibacter flavus]
MPSSRSLLRLLALLLFSFATYPTLLWYFRRSTDQSDEPLGLIALATALFFILRQLPHLRINTPVLFIGSLFLLLVRALPGHLPPMIMAATLITVALTSLFIPASKSGITALLILSLPLIASFDFYLGYPMRLAAAEIAHQLLHHLTPFEVQRQGVVLTYQNQIIGVDPPCSGIRMLWTTLFVAATLATLRRLPIFSTLILLSSAVLLVILGNSLRAAILFFPESKIVHLPHWTHEATGLLIQAALLFFLHQIGSRCRSDRKIPILMSPKKLIPITAIILAAPLIAYASSSRPSAPTSFAPFPSTFNGIPLTCLPLSDRETNFLKNFPGTIARFQCGPDEIILRQVTKPTRLLHPSADCFRASGFTLKPLPLFRDPDHQLWSHHQATFNGRHYHLKERIINADATQSQTDISAWYWNALAKPQSGPWLAITQLELIP